MELTSLRMQGSQGSVLDVGRAGRGKVGPETMELTAETKRRHRSVFTLTSCESRSRRSKAATYPMRYQCGPDSQTLGSASSIRILVARETAEAQGEM